MKNLLLPTAVLIGLATMTNAHAFKEDTHRRIVVDAVHYMQRHPDATNYARLLSGVTRAGYTIESFTDAVSRAAADVDRFADTYLCGAISGRCASAPAWGVAGASVNYTSYWHFQNRTQGPDVHGNPFGGYNFSKLKFKGDIDRLAAAWLTDDHLDDGPGGHRGWFRDGTRYDSYGLTEARYRLGTHSTPRMYADFETSPFQPIDNLGQYWWLQFLARPTAQSLGFVLHVNDVLQPHHTWTTSGHHHAGWEGWVRDYYDKEALNDEARVTAALLSYTPLPSPAADVRGIVREGGKISYSRGGRVLSTTDHAVRREVGRLVVPHAIAMVVHLLGSAAGRL